VRESARERERAGGRDAHLIHVQRLSERERDGRERGRRVRKREREREREKERDKGERQRRERERERDERDREAGVGQERGGNSCMMRHECATCVYAPGPDQHLDPHPHTRTLRPCSVKKTLRSSFLYISSSTDPSLRQKSETSVPYTFTIQGHCNRTFQNWCLLMYFLL
jgi:hypothetical protein